MERREFLLTTGATALAGFGAGGSTHPMLQKATMYGLIGKITTVAGKRDEFAAILLEGTGTMPGCLSYVVAQDPSNADALWITEVWENQESHQASLKLPAVQAAISRGRPLIAGFSDRVETIPVGGFGLSPNPR